MKILPILMMRLQGIKYNGKCMFHGLPIIVKSKGAYIELGRKCRIRSGVLTNLIGLYQRTIIVAKDKGRIEIGDAVGMSGATIYARKSITIGANTMIGANTKILDNDFHPIDVTARIENDISKIGTREIIIGKNCFIGCNSIILKGTVLGDNCIVGAGAVVSGKFPDNSVIGGNPAKIISSLKPTAETV